MTAPVLAPVNEVAGPTDHDLVARVRRGDDRAFEALYGRYQRRIAAYIYGMVNDYSRAEDITQDVFISALRRMRETERPIAFKPWVYEIAKNACIDQFRRSRRAEEISYDAEEGLGAADYGRLVTTGPSLDAAVDTKQQLSHLCGAFGGLSETHHQILVLRELEGLSYREIGEKMGLSRPSVESTLFRARRRLTEEYDELVSGQRCVRIQSIIDAASEGMLGTRDTRRLARHVAHCQPCRRQAISAGLDTGTIVRRPVREKIAAKVAAFLPFPLVVRKRHGSAADAVTGTLTHASSMPVISESMAVGWGKAAAAAATLLVAAAGGGVVASSGSDPLGAAPSTPALGAKVARAHAPSTAAVKPVVAKHRSGTSAKSVQRTTGAAVKPAAAHKPAVSTTQSTPTTAKPVKAGSSAPVDPGTLNPTDPSADPKTPPPVNGKGSAGLQEVQDVTTSVDPNAGQAVADLRHQIGQ